MTNNQIRKNNIRNYLIIILIIITFISTSIIAIIMTAGGKITKEGIIETGSIKLFIQPSNRNTSIFLDEKQVKPENGIINNVIPGQHLLRIESSQYHTWEKQIYIRGSLVTSVDIRLFPLEPELKQITQTNISKVFFSEDGNFAYYIVNDENLTPDQNGLWLLRLDEQEIFFKKNFTPTKIIDSSSSIFELLTTEGLKLMPDPNNNKIVIQLDTPQQTYIFDPKQVEPQKQLIDISSQVGFQPEKLYWFNNGNSLIISKQNIVTEYNLTNNEKTLIYYSNDSNIVYSSNDTSLYLYDPINTKLLTYQNKSLKEVDIPNINLPVDITSIQISDDSKSMLLSSNLEHYYLSLDFIKLEPIGQNSTILDFSSDGTRIILNENSSIITITVDKIVTSKDITLNSYSTTLDYKNNPHFINNSNLIAFNNTEASSLQVSEDDGSNIITILGDSHVLDDYYAFQRSGSSVVVLVEDKAEDNILSTNLFKLNFKGGTLPFSL